MGVPLVSGEFGVVAEPQVRFSSNGTAFVNVRAVFKDRVRDNSGQWTDGPQQFINITILGKQGEQLVESVSKGDLIVVSNARLEMQEWESENGKRTGYRLFVDQNASVGVSTRFGIVKTARALESVGVENARAGLGGTPAPSDPWGETAPAEPPW